MTVVRTIIFALMLTLCFSCKHEKKFSPEKIRRIKLKDVIAEGTISSDTVYYGLIKFYDNATNRLVMQAYYSNGKLNGQRTNYYLNGKKKYITFYENGKQNGVASYFDTAGTLISKQNYYYDLPVGNRIDYKNNNPSEYYFTSFDKQSIFYINYDSIQNTDISKINDGSFFFWHTDDIATITTADNETQTKEFFIYIINPPGFNFQYSLCTINSKDSILRTNKVFDTSKIWDTFILDQSKLNRDERYTLRLTFDRSLNDEEGQRGDMLKRL